MNQLLQRLEQRITALEDREAIRNLIATYGLLADSGDASGVAALWTADGTYEVVGFATAKGHREIAALIEGPTHQTLMAQGCAHLIGPVTIDLNGDNATVRGHSVVFRDVGNGANSFEVYRVAANHWTLLRTGEGWRVVHRANALLDGNEAARILLTLT